MEEYLKKGAALCEAKLILKSYHSGSLWTTLKCTLLFISSSEIKLEATKNGKVRLLPANNYPGLQEDIVVI